MSMVRLSTMACSACTASASSRQVPGTAPTSIARGASTPIRRSSVPSSSASVSPSMMRVTVRLGPASSSTHPDGASAPSTSGGQSSSQAAAQVAASARADRHRSLLRVRRWLHCRPRTSRTAHKSVPLTQSRARRIWLRAQRLDESAPFGDGPGATPAAIEHLGYVQIDTINVIERCHHHILYTRIPGYRREHLRQAQTADKTVFEYWTHALSYLPTRAMRFFTGAMRNHSLRPHSWYAGVKTGELRKVLGRIRRNGALTIRDIDDDVLVEKDHEWASRKPSKRALQLAFYAGILTISERVGMLKTYELMDRHFAWEKRPKAATERTIVEYLLDRALRAQGIVSLDSICFQDAPRKPAMRRLIEARVRRKDLVPVKIEGAEKAEHWARPEALDDAAAPSDELVHILSPFDPLIIQRK